MEKSVKITSIIVAGVLVLALISVWTVFQFKPSNTINVQGEATVSVNPDLVGLYFNVETNGSTAKEAKDANAEIMDAVITALVKEGFERKDITTSNFNVYEDYDWSSSSRKSLGYKAVHSVKLEMSTENSDDIGSAIDAGIDFGAILSYINFELSPELQNDYKTQALKKATEDARIKAESMAEGLGQKLGKVISTSDSSMIYYPWNAYTNSVGYASGMDVKEDAMRAVSSDIQPGEREISARVSVIYKLN